MVVGGLAPGFSPRGLAKCLQLAYNVGTVADTLGPFEQAVLLAIVALGDAAYGRAVHRQVARRLDREIAAGAVFATLERLERKKLLTSRLEPGGDDPGGRPRRFYKPRASAFTALNETRAMMDAVWHRIPKPLRAGS